MSFSFQSNILPKYDLSPKSRRQLERVLGGAVSVCSALRTQGGLLFFIQPLVCWLSDTILRIPGTGQPVLWFPNKRRQLAPKSAQLPKQLHSSGDHGLSLVVIFYKFVSGVTLEVTLPFFDELKLFLNEN